ncbi:hypothetical protein EYF80_041038 [Liparis tanakae]|uniref:Uncharacterized protein n=1 Tax=Liparis tanakae TaxID=230148 RepID=A0A4Z2G7H2_9TELE|nr:hypothetical protein EYF80_041038 [Liparis tanakae]
MKGAHLSEICKEEDASRDGMKRRTRNICGRREKAGGNVASQVPAHNGDLLQSIERKDELIQRVDIENIGWKFFICQLVLSQADKLQFGFRGEKALRHAVYVSELQVELLQRLGEVVGDLPRTVFSHIQYGQRLQTLGHAAGVLCGVTPELKGGEVGHPLEQLGKDLRDLVVTESQVYLTCEGMWGTCWRLRPSQYMAASGSRSPGPMPAGRRAAATARADGSATGTGCDAGRRSNPLFPQR